MIRRLTSLLPSDPAQRIFVGFVLLLVTSGVAALLGSSPMALLPVAGAVGLLVLFTEWRLLYYLLFLTWPSRAKWACPAA